MNIYCRNFVNSMQQCCVSVCPCVPNIATNSQFAMDTVLDTGMVVILVLFSCHLTLIRLSLYHKLMKCSHHLLAMPFTLLFQGMSDTTHREGPASAAIVQNQQTSTHTLVISNHSNWTGGLLLCYSLIPVPPLYHEIVR